LLCDYLAVTPDLRSISSCALFSELFELLYDEELSPTLPDELYEELPESEKLFEEPEPELESALNELLLDDSDAEPSWLNPLAEERAESLLEKLLLDESFELPEKLLEPESLLLPLEELS